MKNEAQLCKINFGLKISRKSKSKDDKNVCNGIFLVRTWKTECCLLASANRADPIFTDIKIESACSNGDQS